MSFIRKHVYFVKKKRRFFPRGFTQKKMENFTNFLRQDFEVLHALDYPVSQRSTAPTVGSAISGRRVAWANG
jgi:hypothetical protein